MSDLTDAVAAIRGARGDYETADRYYRGQVAEVFASPAIRKRLEGASLPRKVNFARKPVSVVLQRLKLLSATVAGSDEDSAWLAELAKRNELPLEIPFIHRAALVFGDAFAVVWPGDEPGDVGIFYNSPLVARVFYDDENPRLRRYAAKLWVARGALRANLYYPDRVEKWALAEDAKNKGDDDADWEHFTGDGDWELPHELGEVPVFHFRTDRPYGEPIHIDAYGPQDAITTLVCSQLSTTNFHAYPQRYAISGATDSLGGFGGLDDLDDETRAPDAGTSNLKAGPGELWTLRNVTSVGQFASADVEAFLKPLAFYIRAMAACTEIPLHHFEPSGDAPSGESLREMDVPLAARASHIRESFGATHKGMLRCALRAGGRDGAGEVSVWWAPLQTISDLAGWQAVNEKVRAGVPARQALLEAGYSAEQVEAWGYAEGPEIQPKVALLATLGAAVRDLGAGVALGVVSADQVQRAVADVLGEDAGGEAAGGAGG